jgi:hypothetical protein
MNRIISLTKLSRQNYLNYLNRFDMEALNQIPQGFNNNMIWNIGHIVAVFDALCYSLSGNENYTSSAFIEKYKKGTTPETSFTEADRAEIANLLILQIEKFEKDSENNVFQNYTEYKTSFQNTLENIEDAIQFNLIHEGIHFGYLMNIARNLKK